VNESLPRRSTHLEKIIAALSDRLVIPMVRKHPSSIDPQLCIKYALVEEPLSKESTAMWAIAADLRLDTIRERTRSFSVTQRSSGNLALNLTA
jgi:hypothetical protein